MGKGHRKGWKKSQQTSRQMGAKWETSDKPPVDASEPLPRTFSEKLGAFWASTPVWGAIGVLIGALISQLSLKLLFLGIWAVVFMEFIRVGFFHRPLAKILGNITMGLIMAVGCFELWKLSPKPQEPTTLDQQMDAFARRFPWLGQPPRTATSQTTKRVPINPCAGKGFLNPYKNICDGQVGQWAIDEAAKLESMADQVKEANESSVWRFTNDFADCCAQDIKDLRTELFGRLGPAAKDPDEVSAWKSLFLNERFPGMRDRIIPMIVKLYVPYFRRLGLRLKRKEIPRSAPILLHFSERNIVPEEKLSLPVAVVAMADQFSGVPHQRFPYGLNVTITTKALISTGFIVIEFDNRYAAVGCDVFGCSSVLDAKFVENKDVADLLSAQSQLTTYFVRVGETPLTSERPLHVEALSNFPIHAKKVTHFDE